jgi:ParB-like chromosome segregation protein Spo0J
VVRDKGRKAVEVLSTKLERLAIDYVPIDSIEPNDFNSNRMSDHDWSLLKKSMQTDGFTVPILVNRESRVITDGEHRWRMSKELGFTEIPVVFVEQTAAQMRVSMLRHNRARGSEDIDLTAQLLRDLEKIGALDWAQDELLLDDVEIQRMINDVAAPEALAAEEFSRAWVPDGAHHAEETQQGDLGRTIGGAQAIEGITQSASDRQREAEKRIAAAKSDEERISALRDRDIHRVALTFSGDEAKIVREALGDRPADKLLDLCKAEIARRMPA